MRRNISVLVSYKVMSLSGEVQKYLNFKVTGEEFCIPTASNNGSSASSPSCSIALDRDDQGHQSPKHEFILETSGVSSMLFCL